MRPLVVIDDEKAQLDLIHDILTMNDYEIHCFQNLDQAFQAIKVLEPALVLCDYRMPEMDGVSFCRKIRQAGLIDNGYFIIITGLVELGEEDDDFHDLPDGWIPKKFSVDEFLEIINRWYQMVPVL